MKNLYYTFMVREHGGCALIEMPVQAKNRGLAFLKFCQHFGFKPSQLIICNYWSVKGSESPTEFY